MRKLLLLLFISYNLSAQFQDKVQVSSGAGIITATDNTPFLLRNREYGTVPLESNFLYLNTRVIKDYDSLSRQKSFDYGFGIEPHLNAGKNTQFLLPEAYIKGRFKALEIYVGRRREVFGLVDTLGTMGSLIWSGNALPVPKVDIGFRNFVPLTKNGLLAIKGNFAHGWLGSGDSVQNVLLHQKSLYVRVGKPQWKVRMVAGFNHQVQWGGQPTVPYIDPISGQKITKYDATLQNYIRVVTGISLGAETGLSWDDVDGIPGNEAGNRMGNHLGTIDIGFEFEVQGAMIKLYRQSIYEDGSLFYLSNISDGLTGISLKGRNGLNLCFEYLDTRNQGGPIYYDFIPELRGADNYFNNGVYKDSWTYQGNTIGNALLNPYHQNPTVFPGIQKPIPNYIYNNRVQSFSLNAHYRIEGIQLNSHLISTRNLGHYALPLDLSQLSIQQAGRFRLKDFDVVARLAADIGKYYKNSYGLNLGIVKNW